jgi:drug/metabolite transporter (DMT)-like permease
MGPDATSAGDKLRADGVLLFITAVWGGTFVVVKDALGEADPFAFLAVRFALGGVAALAIARRRALDPPVLKAGALLGVFLFAGFALQTSGLVHTTESRSAFITGLAVVLVPIVSIVLFRRLPKPPTLLGVAMALGGLHVLTGGLSPEQAAPAQGEANLVLGDLLTLGCALTFAFHIALTERFAPRVPAMALVAVQLWVVSLLSGGAAVVTSAQATGSLAFWLAAAFTGLFASTLAIGLQTWAQARTTAVRAGLIFSLEPVFAAALSATMGRDTLGPREMWGGGILIGAVVVAEAGNALWARRRPPAR